MGKVLRCDVESVEWLCGGQCNTFGMRAVEGWLRCGWIGVHSRKRGVDDLGVFFVGIKI
jgi:hypothetical protein